MLALFILGHGQLLDEALEMVTILVRVSVEVVEFTHLCHPSGGPHFADQTTLQHVLINKNMNDCKQLQFKL
jgi:hypothetical protein